MSLDTTHSNHFYFKADPLEIEVLGGVVIDRLESLRVTLKVKNGEKAVRHNLDLYNDFTVEKFVRRVAERIEIGTIRLRKAIEELTTELEAYRIAQSSVDDEPTATIYVMSNEEKAEALEFLQSPNLIERTNELIGKSGVIGEESNRLLMYIIFTSRLMDNPLHVVSLGSSGSGKTHLQTSVAELLPPESRFEVTVFSENALYYLGQHELKHRLLQIEDLDGVESALYPLRELQSKGRITKTIANRNKQGLTKAMRLTVEGPVSVAGLYHQRKNLRRQLQQEFSHTS